MSPNAHRSKASRTHHHPPAEYVEVYIKSDGTVIFENATQKTLAVIRHLDNDATAEIIRYCG